MKMCSIECRIHEVHSIPYVTHTCSAAYFAHTMKFGSSLFTCRGIN